VNHVELENYIRGVVPNESPASWPLEALKAQAVAARSYALGTNSGNPVFDQYDTVASQVYGGYSTETARSNRAVARTSGEVLRYDGRVIVAYFHSTSCGYTENNENVWGGEPRPYLRGVRDPWDRVSPYHHWKVGYSARSLGNAMGVGRLRSVRIHKRGVSGRIVRATFRGTAGRNRVDGWNGIRGRLGLRDIPRTFKRISSSGSTARAAVAGLGSRVLARDVSGSVAPAQPGARVRVERRNRDGWQKVAHGRLGRSGKYRIPVEAAGLYRVITAGYAGPAVRVR
jgi:stage II sporulation protein D